MRYKTQVVITFSQVDGAGRLFFSRLFELCHVVYEGFLAHVGLPLHQHLAERDWIMPVVSAHADYHLPMVLGAPIDVEITPARLGGKSITWQYSFFNPQGQLAARATLVHACMDQRSQHSRPLPEELRQLLEPWVRGAETPKG